MIEFIDEPVSSKVYPSDERWNILIVDDDEGVHEVTRLVLSDFAFDNKGVTFYSALSAESAKEILKAVPDIAVVFLDVVMESDNSGLKLVHYIRKELLNQNVRIILRTGQPGVAPENEIVENYDINDYRSKEELTSQKLTTSLYCALRSYRDIKTIDTYKSQLVTLLKSSGNLYKPHSMQNFATVVLEQLLSILSLHTDAFFCHSSAYEGDISLHDFVVLAATGCYAGTADSDVFDVVDREVGKLIYRAATSGESISHEGYYVGYFKTRNGTQNIIFIRDGWHTLHKKDRELIELYCSNLSIAFENVYQSLEYVDTQKEIFYTMSEIAETCSLETGNHVRRVSHYAALLGEKLGLSKHQIELLKLATPMHDIGKLAIPDSILQKPGELSVQEFEIIKKHASIGFEMLKKSKREVFQVAAMIAHQHQEKYDGSGYPKGLKGAEIHIFSRITTIVDVFDALLSVRSYKPAWEKERVVSYIEQQRGKHFDPIIVDLFLDSIDEFLNIHASYPDGVVIDESTPL